MIPDPTYDWLETPVLSSSEVQSETEPDTKTVLTTKEPDTNTVLKATTESSPLPLQPFSVLPETLVVKEKLLKLTHPDMGTISLIVSVVSLCVTLICKI